MSKPSHLRPAGHVPGPAAAIALLSILLAAGLNALGILDRVNLVIAEVGSQGRAADFPKSLPGWAPWLAAVLVGSGLAWAILGVPGTWRRLVLWITAVVVVAAWAPVLSLAAHAPDIAAPLIAAVWAGVCAVVYAGNHRMACDEIPIPMTDEAR